MRAHIVTVINSRTRVPAPMIMMSILSEEANDHVANKNSVSGGGEGKPDKKCFRCGRIGHMRADCNAKTHVNGGPPKSAPKLRIVGNCEEEKSKKSCKMCR